MEPPSQHLHRRALTTSAHSSTKNYTALVASFFNSTIPPSLSSQRAGYYLPPLEITFLTLSTLFVILRLYSRYVSSSFGPDDVFVFLALVCGCILTTLNITAVYQWGLGRHYTDHARVDYEMLGVLEWANSFVFVLSALFAKMSILCFYLRFAEALGTTFRYAVYTTMTFVTLWTLSIAAVLVSACRPLYAWWSVASFEKHGGRQCMSTEDVGIVLFLLQGVNMVSDVVVYLLPVKVLWKHLRGVLGGWQRVRVMCLPVLGLLACIIAAVRIKPLVDLLFGADPSWSEYPLYTLVAIEIDIIITCACLPFSKPAFLRILSLKCLSSIPIVSSLLQKYGPCTCSSPMCERSHESRSKEDEVVERVRRPSAAHVFGDMDCMIYCEGGGCGRVEGEEERDCEGHVSEEMGDRHDGSEVEKGEERIRDRGRGRMVESSSSEGTVSTGGTSGTVKFNDVVFS